MTLIDHGRRLCAAVCFTGLLVAACSAAETPTQANGYDALTALFEEWREFEHPGYRDGAPDYTPESMQRRADGLPGFRERLEAIDHGDWSTEQRIDWHLLWAEMNGLDYYLNILQPWARDPGYYASVRTYQSDTPAEEGPTIHDALRLWEYPVWPRTQLSEPRPLNDEEESALAAELRVIPALLEQARGNLNGDTADLWSAAVNSFDGQVRALDRLEGKIAEDAGDDLVTALAEAREATVAFRDWVAGEAPNKSGPSGIGRDNYTWHLRNVLLVNLSWEEEKTIVERELARSHMSLRAEEARNRDLPPLEAAASPEAFERLQHDGIDEYISFMDERDIVTIKPFYDRALRERTFGFVEPDDRNFFLIVHHKTPLPLWAHFYHYWDLEQMVEEPHESPIRRDALLYNVWMSRAEGVATGMEEWTLHAGLYDDNPRAREVVWIMLATRAARGLASLHAHDNAFDMAEASDFHVEHTPRGWMRRDSLLGFEQQLYLQQPGYGTSYVSGARIIDDIIKQRADQLGDDFTLRQFFDEMNDAGMIPVSLLRWQLTGDASDIEAIVESYQPL